MSKCNMKVKTVHEPTVATRILVPEFERAATRILVPVGPVGVLPCTVVRALEKARSLIEERW